jgi:hypothetical protein
MNIMTDVDASIVIHQAPMLYHGSSGRSESGPEISDWCAATLALLPKTDVGLLTCIIGIMSMAQLQLR